MSLITAIAAAILVIPGIAYGINAVFFDGKAEKEIISVDETGLFRT